MTRTRSAKTSDEPAQSLSFETQEVQDGGVLDTSGSEESESTLQLLAEDKSNDAFPHSTVYTFCACNAEIQNLWEAVINLRASMNPPSQDQELTLRLKNLCQTYQKRLKS